MQIDTASETRRESGKDNPGEQFVFNSLEYARTYRGEVEYSEGLATALFIRKIPGTLFCDGMLPWPYIRFRENRDEQPLGKFAEIVSLTGVIMPSQFPPKVRADGTELLPFKDHFIFDPELGVINLSKKSRFNLRKGSKIWSFVDNCCGGD